MYRYKEGQNNSTRFPVHEMPATSDHHQTHVHPPRPLSGPPSPTLQISHLLHQTAQLIAVNAQLKKEIEQVRGTGAMAPGSAAIPSALSHDVAFEPHHNTGSSIRHVSGKKSPKPDSYKTVMCQAWLESKVCLFGENCRFAHGEQELRPSRILPKQNSKYKTKLCDKYTTTGLCPYGNRCLFIHPDNGGSNAYIRSDRLIEVSQRHALADLNAQGQRQKPESERAPSPFMIQSLLPDLEATPKIRSSRPLGPPPSWPLEPSTFFQEKNDGPGQQKCNLREIFGCFDTPNRVSLGGVSDYSSGGSSPAHANSSPFSTTSSSSINLNITDDERDFEFFRLTGLDSLAEELTRNLTTNEFW